MLVESRTGKIDQRFAASRSQITVIAHVFKTLNMTFVCLFKKAIMKLNKNYDFEICVKTNKVNKWQMKLKKLKWNVHI